MAVVEMQRLILVGNNKERKDLLKTLHRLGCVEIDKTHEIEDLGNIDRTERKEDVQVSLAKIALAFDVIKDKKMMAKSLAKKKVLEYKPPKKEFLVPKPVIDFDDFIALEDTAGDTFKEIDEIADLNNELVVMKSEEAKNNNIISTMSLYKEIDMSLAEFRDTKNVSVFLGTIQSNKKQKLEETLKDVDFVAYEFAGDGTNVAILVTCLREKSDEVNETLMSFDFSPINSREDAKPSEIIAHAEAANKEIEERRNEIVLEILSHEEDLKQFQLLYDYYTLENDKVSREEGMRTTKTSFVLEGWVPKMYSENIAKTLDESSLTLAYTMREPVEGENPPSLVVDNALVTPYQSVTNMFSAPKYGEIDPNPVMSIFFFLFFGMMVSDAMYGLLMTIATGIALWRLKPRKDECSLLKILFWGGISTMFWGVMFGSYFGEEWIPHVLLSPINDAPTFMMLSIGMGLVQMLVGLGMNAYSLFRQKKPLDAIFGVFSWYILIIGIAFMLVKEPWGKPTMITLIVVGLVGLMIAGSLHAKGLKKISGAFGGLYGIINFFSDLLSYTRLFGLGLSTGVIAMVLNIISKEIVVLAPILLIGGHLFNIGINALGAYVHNSRLQFIEFFGKFYEGGGHLFAPLGSNMKYYNLNDK